MTIRLCLLACLSLNAFAAAVDAAPAAALTPGATIEIPNSTGKFDFLRVDTKRHRLLASHENDGTADFVDLQKNVLIQRVKVGGAVDMAPDNDSKFYYVSVQEAERVAVVDAESLQEVGSVKTPGPTDAIIYEPRNHLVYVTHDNGAEVWVIDPASAKVVATVAIPGVPEFMVYDDNADRIYLNIKTRDAVVVIDPATNKVTGRWPTAPALQPHGLAIDAANHRIFTAGANGKLVMIDTTNGATLGSADIAAKVDQIAYDSAGGFVYCAGADHMTVVATTGGKLATFGDVTTAATARNVAVDPATGAVWTTYSDGKNSYARSWSPPKH